MHRRGLKVVHELLTITPPEVGTWKASEKTCHFHFIFSSIFKQLFLLFLSLNNLSKQTLKSAVFATGQMTGCTWYFCSYDRTYIFLPLGLEKMSESAGDTKIIFARKGSNQNIHGPGVLGKKNKLLRPNKSVLT